MGRRGYHSRTESNTIERLSLSSSTLAYIWPRRGVNDLGPISRFGCLNLIFQAVYIRQSLEALEKQDYCVTS